MAFQMGVSKFDFRLQMEVLHQDDVFVLVWQASQTTLFEIAREKLILIPCFPCLNDLWHAKCFQAGDFRNKYALCQEKLAIPFMILMLDKICWQMKILSPLINQNSSVSMPIYRVEQN